MVYNALGVARSRTVGLGEGTGSARYHYSVEVGRQSGRDTGQVD